MDETQQVNKNAVYYEISPTTVCAIRLFGVLVAIMVIVSFVLALVQGADNPTFYLLACNVIISSFAAVILAWWYRGGDLASDKFWFLILVGAVIVTQCITTDIYVFHVIPIPQDHTTTMSPNRSTFMTTHNATNHTTNRSLDWAFFTSPATATPIQLAPIAGGGL